MGQFVQRGEELVVPARKAGVHGASAAFDEDSFAEH
jgi:hypothetical protein